MTTSHTVLTTPANDLITTDSLTVYAYTVDYFSLAAAVAVGLLATGIALRAASRMHGGLFGSVLNFFGIGMFLVLLGFIATIIPGWASPGVVTRTYDVLFTIGYIFMLMGSQNLITLITPTQKDTDIASLGQ